MSGKKLLPIAKAVAELLHREFGPPANFSLEEKLDWLGALPLPEDLGPKWAETCKAYASLVDQKFDLPGQIEMFNTDLRRGPQRVDVWFGAPYCFALEFDESQHFNQFRLRTLEVFSGYKNLPFDFEGYVRKCQSKNSKPGKSGFTRLSGLDPLFPPIPKSEAQDNRTRQRAFRDFLKDIVPLARPKTNPTWRVGSYVIGGKHKDFSEMDCKDIVRHLIELRVLDSLQLVE